MTTVMFIPPNVGNQIQTSQGIPATIIQPPGMGQYVQYGGQQFTSPSNPREGVLEILRRAETKTLGAIQIMIGLTHIGLGGVLLFPFRVIIVWGYTFWGGIFFLISGALAVSSEKHQGAALVNCSVGMNITSAVISFIGIILYFMQLSINGPGVNVLLLLFCMLELCITVSTAHFGCQVACCKKKVASNFLPYSVTVASVTPPVASVTPPVASMAPPLPDYNIASPSPKTEAY